MEWRSDQTGKREGGHNLPSSEAQPPALLSDDVEAGRAPRVVGDPTANPEPWSRPSSDSGHSAPRPVIANAGDHKLIHALLRAVHQAPSYDDFSTWLDEPTYEPSDRLLVKHDDQLVAHVHVLRRAAWFDGVQVPLGSVMDLAALPEYRHAGYERLLLTAAEHAMREAKAVVSLVCTTQTQPLHGSGWTDTQAQGYTQANVNDILAHLLAQGARWPRRPRRLRVRRWRHVELDAVRDVYDAAASQLWGALHRPETYWRWLVGRKAHSELIVAVEGSDEWEDLENVSHIVGYAVMQGSQVVELCCRPAFARAAPRLLARACRDAIEQDCHTISLHTPPGDPLHELMVMAGGTWCGNGSRAGGKLLVKLLDPAQWIEIMYPVLRKRAKAAGIDRPCELGFDLGVRRCRLVVTRRSSRLETDAAAASDVQCAPDVFSALLVGNLHVGRACEAGQIRVADDAVLAKLAAFFPPALFWQSQFDVLRF